DLVIPEPPGPSDLQRLLRARSESEGVPAEAERGHGDRQSLLYRPEPKRRKRGKRPWRLSGNRPSSPSEEIRIGRRWGDHRPDSEEIDPPDPPGSERRRVVC